jgi:hypothetical protein
MAKPIPKRSPKFRKRASAREKSKWFPKKPTLIAGIDISMSSIAMAGIWYDVTMKKIKGPEFQIWRWPVGTHYFNRLEDVVRIENYIDNLLGELNAFVEKENMYFAVEEPWPFGMVKQMQSSFLKQQAEMSGALLGGLLRYGVEGIFQINSKSWQKVVADDLGITTHHSKWKSQRLADEYNCNFDDSGKWRAKEWALSKVDLPSRVPDWPDIITSTKYGKVPRPQGSTAKAIQPDDRYDALGIMEYMRREIWRDICLDMK